MNKKALIEILNGVINLDDAKSRDIIIDNITYDSRKVKPGSLFIAIKGFLTDGHKFLADVDKNGAAAAVVEIKKNNISIPQFVVKNSRAAMARIAYNFYSSEISSMRTIGITGTNGKTTIAYLVKSILDAAGLSSGLIGTIGYDIGDGENIPSWNTTPESVDLFAMMYSMYQNGKKGCVMEVSSHGLELNRVDSISFETAVFSNLSHDHLDFHDDVENYFLAKKKLFSLLNPKGTAVINIEDEYGRRLNETISQNIISFGLNSVAKVYAQNWKSSLDGVFMNVKTPIGELEIISPLIGQFNVENILAAISVGMSFNIDLTTIKKGIEQMKKVPGRLEPVQLSNNRIGVIDYSHTPDALKKALIELNKITENRLFVVFGCGGDRDRSKRPIMGKIAEDYATNVIVTSDNPRTENPDKIIEDIMAGIYKREYVVVEADRKKAIQIALQNSGPKDMILVAGKGHEDYQDINGVKYPFDDSKIIRELDE